MSEAGAGTTVLWWGVLSLAVVLAIGLWAARRTRSPGDFFVAGRSVGLIVLGLATMSAAFSGFFFIGGPGLTYRLGVSSLFICLPVGFTPALLCWTVGRRMRRLADVREIFTVPDVVRCRFGRKPAALAAIAVFLGSVAYLGAQLQALAILVEAVFGTRAVFGAWSLPVAMALGAAVLVTYAAAGGMLAGVYTDVVQGCLMIVAAVAVCAQTLRAGGGPGRILDTIAASDRFGPEFLDPLGGAPLLTAFGFYLLFGVGTLGQPQLLHKFLMLADVEKLRWMPLVLGVAQSLCILIWLSLGLVVPALVVSGRLPLPAGADDAVPTFLLHGAPEALAGLVFAAVLAAILSTADSLVNIASAALVRDLPAALGRRPADTLRGGRIAVLGIAAAAAGLALLYGDLVALLGTFAFATFGATLAPALGVGLNWSRVSSRAAVASMTTGLVLTLGLELVVRQRLLPGLAAVVLPEGVLPSTVALAAALTVLFAVSWLSPGKELDTEVAVALELEPAPESGAA